MRAQRCRCNGVVEEPSSVVVTTHLDHFLFYFVFLPLSSQTPASLPPVVYFPTTAPTTPALPHRSLTQYIQYTPAHTPLPSHIDHGLHVELSSIHSLCMTMACFLFLRLPLPWKFCCLVLFFHFLLVFECCVFCLWIPCNLSSSAFLCMISACIKTETVCLNFDFCLIPACESPFMVLSSK